MKSDSEVLCVCVLFVVRISRMKREECGKM